MDLSISATDKEKIWISADDRHWIQKVRKLAEKHPDEVRIIKSPEENDGCIYATMPMKWLKLNDTVRKLTEEQRKAATERLAAIRNSRKP